MGGLLSRPPTRPSVIFAGIATAIAVVNTWLPENSPCHAVQSILDVQAELESLVRLDHLPELLQGEELTIDDEGDLLVCIGDSPSHSLVGSLEIAG